MLEQEYRQLEKRNKLWTLEEETRRSKVEVEKLEGEIRALNLQREKLAGSASELRMRELLLTAMPGIVEGAYKPLKNVGPIRMLNVAGANEGGLVDNSLTSVLASMSTLPMLREVLGFLSAFDDRSTPEFSDEQKALARGKDDADKKSARVQARPKLGVPLQTPEAHEP